MQINNLEVTAVGKVFKTARLSNEWYDFVDDPESFVGKLREASFQPDAFTFLQKLPHARPIFSYYHDIESISVLPITTYDEWWKNQISDKTRNMIRKAEKRGLAIRVADFDDRFVAGLKEIYDEAPVRQGMRFWHYKKDIETLRRIHVTYLTRTQFIGAYLDNELVGFIKLVFNDGNASFMQIISKISHRDKAPNNAMIAKAVEICAGRGIPYILYGAWSRRGLGEFKSSHGFERYNIPRYFIPITTIGKLMVQLKLYRTPSDYVPEKWLDTVAEWRARYYAYRYKTP